MHFKTFIFLKFEVYGTSIVYVHVIGNLAKSYLTSMTNAREKTDLVSIRPICGFLNLYYSPAQNLSPPTLKKDKLLTYLLTYRFFFVY